jgi:sec-independent protein translocase protein TatA
MGPLGWQETVFIFVLALLIFGPKKLPELGKTIGKALTEFRRASSELKSTWDREMITLERENESLKEAASAYQGEINDYASSYSYEEGGTLLTSGDSTADTPSTVSASAAEGAELTADATPNSGVATTEGSGEGEVPAQAAQAAPAPKADGDAASEPQRAAS